MDDDKKELFKHEKYIPDTDPLEERTRRNLFAEFSMIDDIHAQIENEHRNQPKFKNLAPNRHALSFFEYLQTLRIVRIVLLLLGKRVPLVGEYREHCIKELTREYARELGQPKEVIKQNVLALIPLIEKDIVRLKPISVQKKKQIHDSLCLRYIKDSVDLKLNGETQE